MRDLKTIVGLRWSELDEEEQHFIVGRFCCMTDTMVEQGWLRKEQREDTSLVTTSLGRVALKILKFYAEDTENER